MSRPSDDVSGGVPLLRSFGRAQVAAGLATAVDYGLLFVMTEAFHVWYMAATAAGAITGALTNFLLNRHWSFEAAAARVSGQAWRYLFVSAGSLLLNLAGVYILTEWLGLHYALSVIVAAVVVGVGFNFPLHRHFVFRKRQPHAAFAYNGSGEPIVAGKSAHGAD